MIKAVIFDCFGVLVGGSLEQFATKYFDDRQDQIRQVYDLNDQASLGLITYDEQIDEFAKMAGITVEQAHVEMDNNPRNNRLISYVRNNLYGKYKIGFLSNASDDWLNELFEKEDVAMFDDVVLSYAFGLAKPDARIYELSASRLGVNPNECVFIDDIERYARGAEEVGMKSITYKNFSQFESELSDILKMADADK